MVEDYDLGGNNLEAYYHELETLRAMAVDVQDADRRRLWELVAHGIERVPYATRLLIGRRYKETRGFYFFGATKERDADPLAVRAVAEVIAEMEPDWVRAVDDARSLADAPEVIAAWCEVPIEAVLAVIGNWRTRL